MDACSKGMMSRINEHEGSGNEFTGDRRGNMRGWSGRRLRSGTAVAPQAPAGLPGHDG